MRDKTLSAWVSENAPKAHNMAEMDDENLHNDSAKVDKKGCVEDSSAFQDDELTKLQAALAQREAACLRLEGENFMLNAQVQQMQIGGQEMIKEVRSCQSYLAQAQQVLECIVNSRMSLRGDVEQVRAILSAARRSVRKVLNIHEGSPQGGSGRMPGSPPSFSRPRTSTTSGHRPNKAGVHGETGSCQATKSPKPGQHVRQVGGKERQERREEPRTSPGRFRVGSAGTGGTGSLSDEATSVALPSPPSPDLKPSEPSQPDRTAGASSPPRTTGEVAKKSGAGASGASLTQLADLQTQILQQRDLLVAAIRKGAQAEEKVLNMKDDLTRKDVIIHNLKQEVGVLKNEQVNVQQELQNQNQLFESQLQLLQQQHHAQQMQQAQQCRQLEAMLQRAQQPLAQDADASPLSDAHEVSLR